MGRQVCSVLLGSFGCSLEVVGFDRVRWAYSGAPRGSSVSFRFFGFIQAHPVGRWVHSSSLHSGGRTLVVVRFSWVYLGAPRVLTGSFGFVGFIRAFPVVVGCIRVRCVHLGAHWWSLGTFWRALGVVGFIRIGSVRSGAPWV